MNDTNLTSRIESLENRIMHQEAALDEITLTLLKQEQLINRQLKAIETLQGQIQSLSDTGVTSSGDEPPPPHY